ncbi:DUF4097 family beta strand repeat-containing protein [Shewanella litorisediminis]|uniref:DUF4097 family beta strand repeat protein n=1 Tax=Shewanella litorisediminis TaxID=1173586 RepID=A0ABX7G0R2_9GAMM|nr:DUF4097 family beta strand repeat-containing protein [Shewanella litorisediminis]MCL2919854.1 DUF4097 family beta strand repeat-containing protein [Shewanella litorisediminis]QRH00894.1 DUF4097 family beta strand repeat protein [Shewanella litorisediminis]
MKTLHSLSLLCLLASPLFAAEQIDQSLDVGARVVLDLRVQRGQVEISPWDQNKIQVQGTLDELSEGLIFENQGGRILLEDKMPKSYQGKKNKGSDLVIKVPAKLTLHAESVSADYRVKGLEGDLGFGTVSGDIKASSLGGKVSFNTVSGEVDATQLAGNIKIETVSGAVKDNSSTSDEASYKSVSGSIQLNNEAQTVRIEQVSGDTEATLPSARGVQYNAVSGDAELTLKGDVKLSGESVSGDLSVKLLGDADVRVAINGGPGGKIHNGLTNEAPKKPKYGPGSNLDMVLGNGKGVIELSTLSGTLSVE